MARRQQGKGEGHDSAPAYVSKSTRAYLEGKVIAGNKNMSWPAESPYLNSTDNLWEIIKRHVYPADKQYISEEQLWEAIKDVCAALEPQEIQNLTSSMDNRLF